MVNLLFCKEKMMALTSNEIQLKNFLFSEFSDPEKALKAWRFFLVIKNDMMDNAFNKGLNYQKTKQCGLEVSQ